MEEKGYTLEYIFDTYFDKTYNYIYKQLNNQDDSEELTSKIWEKLYINFEKIKLKDQKYVNNYIFRITKNILIDYYRKKKIKMESLDNMDQIYHFTDNLNPETLLNQSEKNDKIDELLKKLPIQQSMCIELKYMEGMKNKDIAKTMNINENTVASNLKRGLSKLKKLYEVQ